MPLAEPRQGPGDLIGAAGPQDQAGEDGLRPDDPLHQPQGPRIHRPFRQPLGIRDHPVLAEQRREFLHEGLRIQRHGVTSFSIVPLAGFRKAYRNLYDLTNSKSPESRIAT